MLGVGGVGDGSGEGEGARLVAATAGGEAGASAGAGAGAGVGAGDGAGGGAGGGAASALVDFSVTPNGEMVPSSGCEWASFVLGAGSFAAAGCDVDSGGFTAAGFGAVLVAAAGASAAGGGAGVADGRFFRATSPYGVDDAAASGGVGSPVRFSKT